ncbi:glycosyltransferase family 9 protein [Mumia sp. Pv 4-285]|uniref:glycosyltransferase family 9 protein n=1 Tax=Mumia qirimensis TaxID=3234852 RepID=UPI00351D4645
MEDFPRAAGRLLAVRLDSAGDVLLAGPAVRAMAAAGEVDLLVGPAGADAARLLPGVDEVHVWTCPWIVAGAPAVDPASLDDLVTSLAGRYDHAVVFTSFHQSALPTALVLRLAGVSRISAYSEDYPGSLLDDRVAPPGDVPEAERALDLARRAGFALPADDDGRLRVRLGAPTDATPLGRFVVVHPGTSAPARAWEPRRWRACVRALTRAGHQVAVSGSPSERDLTAYVAGPDAVDLGGRTTLAELAVVLSRADALVVANTGPAHLAAATGTPVVSLFAPTVPLRRWAPYGVPLAVLGDQDAPCRGTRAVRCPVPDHPCLGSVTPDAVVEALTSLLRDSSDDAALSVKPPVTKDEVNA